MSIHPGWPATLAAGPVTLRPPRRRDARDWSRSRIRNEQWLTQWEPTSSLSWAVRNSVGEYHRTVSRLRSAGRSGLMLPFTIFYGDTLVGQMNVSNIIRGALRSGSVGYWVDSAVAGRGIAPTALALLVDHALTAGNLHRVEINIRPENAPSLRVVTKLGLRQEGYHERFLDIGGAWRDHLSFAVTTDEVLDRPALGRLPSLPIPPG
jgi:[ribosomal protein S5]-alanine N-acetyltransferase